MASNDAVVLRLRLENAQLAKDLRKAEAGFQKLESSAKKSAGGINDSFSKLGNSVNSSFVGIASKIGPIGAAIGAVTLAATALVNEMVKVSKAVADMADQAESLGVTATAFQELRFAANQAGVDADKLVQSMGKLNVVIGEIGEGGNEKAAQVLRDMGISLEQIESLSPDEQFALIADGMQNISSASEKAYAGSVLFGKGYRALIPLLNEGSEGLDDSAESAKRFGLVIGEDTVKQMRKFDDSVELLKTSFNALKANALEPLVNYFNQQFALALDGSKTYLEKVKITADGLYNSLKRVLSLDFTQLKDAPSVGNTDFASASQRAQEAGEKAYNAEKAANDKLFNKLVADDKARAQKLSEIKNKALSATPKASDESAVREAERAKKDAEAYAKKYAETLAEATSRFAGSQEELSILKSGGTTEAIDAQIEQLRIRKDLEQEIADIISADYTKEHTEELIRQAEAQADINKQIAEQKIVLEDTAKALEESNQKLEERLEQQKRVAEQIGQTLGAAFAAVITGAQSARDAVLQLTEALIQAIVKAAILKAFNGGSFGSNFAGVIGGYSAQPSSGPTVRIYNNSGGVVTTRSRGNDTDIIIGQIAKAVSRGGNQLDKAIRRSYSLNRAGV